MTQRHFTATAVVLDSRGRALLLFHKKLQTWLPPGGHVEPNELPDDAALREIYEETGVRAAFFHDADGAFADGHARSLHQPMVILLEDIGGKGDHFHIDLVYLCRALSEELCGNEDETLRVGWFTRGESLLLDMYDNTRAVLKRAWDIVDS